MALDPDQFVKPARKLRKLIGKLARRPAPEEVHKLRTAARHFEAVNETLSPDIRAGQALMKDIRRCRKRAGKVRDMDVLTAFASTVHPAAEQECAVQLLEHLGVQRRKYARKLYREVRRRRSGMRKNLKDTASVIAKRIQANGRASKGNPVASGAAATATSLAAQLAEPDRLTRQNLHPYRLKVKELRDVLKIASGDTPFSDDLARVKDAIGEWHDWEELTSIAQKELNHGSGCKLLAELKRISRDKFVHALSAAQAMRRTYLSTSHPRTSHRPGHPSSAGSPGAPRLPVWDAIAKLTG